MRRTLFSVLTRLVVVLAVVAYGVAAWAAGPQPTPNATTPGTVNTSHSSIKNNTAARTGEPKTVTTASGLKYVDLEIGSGAVAKSGMRVLVDYVGWLQDGTKFDSSIDRREPFAFKIGAAEVIAGWEEGVVGMKVGGKRKLTIPPALAYGEEGAGGGRIPPNATLTFEVNLLTLQ
ncbi:MAG: FKBP-type peptidyl-prolyl cis-trans isomerase [Acidobacteriota bacterium]